MNSANGQSQANQAVGYIAIELDLSSLRLQQYQEIFSAFLVLILGLGLSGVFAFRLMHDVTQTDHTHEEHGRPNSSWSRLRCTY